VNSLNPSHDKSSVATIIAILLAVNLLLTVLLIREATAPTTHEVKITGFAFVPQNLTINPGDSVTWNNTDPVIHTLWFVFVSNGSTYLLSDPIPPDTTWTHTFNDAVELQYYSFERLWITGLITVSLGVHDIAVLGVMPWKTVVGQGFCCNITATIVNEGDFTETLNVTAYADLNKTVIGDEVTIGTQQVFNLPSGNSTTTTFTWNTTGVAKGNYTISAYAWPVPSETNLNNNMLTDDWIIVTIVGDITGPAGWPDGKVDMRDIGLVAKAFGANHVTDPTSPKYCQYWHATPCSTCPHSPNCDIVYDGKIDMKDIGLVARNFGKTDP